MLRIALAVLGVALLIAGLSAYVALTVGRDLRAARAALGSSPEELEADKIARAREHLGAALDGLDSPPARLLSLVPVARQNLSAVEDVAAATVPVLDTGLALDREVDAIQRDGLLDAGSIRLDGIRSLEAPLRKEAEALARLEGSLEGARNGWLVPPLWHELDEQLDRARDLHRSAERAADAALIAPSLLGAQGERTYLLLMLNNAELRGAGGITSGIGTLSVRDGRLSLGRFYYYRDLADEPPYRSVAAPDDFERHFRPYRAATTRWVATSSSPDIPDVAVVARRLFSLTAGEDTDGTLLVDPRGLQALMPPRSEIEVPITGTTVSRSGLADYIFSTAYDELRDSPAARRDALIVVGQAAFAEVIGGGLGGKGSLRSVAQAAAGGHIRFLSARADEQAVLASMGTTWELGTPETDGVLATVQNFGGNKLDFWARRSIAHRCDLGDGDMADCGTDVVLENRVPSGLPRYVYQDRPYGLFKSFVEVYVPERARVTGVEVNGRPEGAFTEAEDGYTAVGVYVQVPRGERADISVGYELPLGDGGYSLEVIPQPLAHDAGLRVVLGVPRGWRTDGPGDLRDGILRYSGDLEERIRWRVGPSEATGLTGLWDALRRFWSEPL